MNRDPVKPSTPQAPATDHLSVRPDDLGPAEVHFLFERREKRMGGAIGASVAAHGSMVLVYFLLVWLAPEPVRRAILPDRLADLIWLAQPGPGGGGGGGNKMPEPPKKAELKGDEKITVPAAVKPVPEEKPEPPPEQLNIPARTLEAGAISIPGALESTQASNSLGSGVGSGAGVGTGSGLGEGRGGGTGGGAYRPGNGVEIPRLLQQVRPQYTADAMRAKVQGVVLLECVVMATGAVGTCEIARSLDSNFGLDQEALKAAKQWRFAPGTRFGEPVAVYVTIELTFTLR
ncbi:MAG: energy transducer TonB [Acidobacteria bacterium]|nr:energy transducer TonB [Acidobacteriota bacterium]